MTDLLTSTAEISNLVSVLSVLAGLLVMLVFLIKLIYQVRADCKKCWYSSWSRTWLMAEMAE